MSLRARRPLQTSNAQVRRAVPRLPHGVASTFRFWRADRMIRVHRGTGGRTWDIGGGLALSTGHALSVADRIVRMIPAAERVRVLNSGIRAPAKGYPIAVIPGRAEVQRTVRHGGACHGATRTAHRVSLAAAKECLRLPDRTPALKTLAAGGQRPMEGAGAAEDGRLVATGLAVPTDDFDRGAHGLVPVPARVWNGFLVLNLSLDPGPVRSDVPLGTLDNWPMPDLVTGHRRKTEIGCTWKVFWENHSECLHCPGIHPELCDRVPVYGKGIMAASEALGWTPDQNPTPALRDVAESWTPDGAACGPGFPGLTEAEQRAGHQFVTMWPSAYVVAHVDHVRAVRIVSLRPERTRLVAEWYFPAETLAQPGFDAAGVAEFAKTVMRQDGEASEMNPRGIRSPAFRAARLMPEDYEVHRFQRWILNEMDGKP